jgi:tetratricopeptide (TPR) repeat protein
MKNIFAVSIVAALLLSCASSGSGTSKSGSADSPVSLETAIELAAEHIAGDLKPGSRIAIVDFESENDNLSHHIMEELTGELLKHKIEVADRQNLPYIFQEFKFQMSGAVSDETAQGLGKILGAELIIVGRLLDIVTMYRNQVDAVHVEMATRESAARNNVRKDRETQRLINALANQQTTVKVYRYAVTEQTKPETAGIFLDRGIMFAMRGEYDKAIADFTEAIRLNPDLAGAYEFRARALQASVSDVVGKRDNFSGIDTVSTLGRVSMDVMRVLEQAIQDYTQAIRLDPNNRRLYNDRGVVFSDMRETDLAIADFNQAIIINPNLADQFNNRAGAYFIKGNFERAFEDFDQAIKLDPNWLLLYRNRGFAYYFIGEWDWAIADFSRVIRMDPNNYSAYNNRAGAYAEKGYWDRAIDDFSQVIRLVPSASAYSNRGLAYYNKGDFDRAIADWETALRINPNDANARRAIEMARRNRGF